MLLPHRRHRSLGTALLVPTLALVALLTACGGGSEGAEPAPTSAPSTGSADQGPAAGQEAAAAARTDGRTVIDVRTTEEFAAGHVDGATLVDFQDPGFAAAIADLDPDGTYVVYCRSGNRSARAASQMQAIGLDVTDGGGLPDMVAAGWPTA